jgi:dTDP-4-dehydrorhamnose reductase
VVGAEGQLGRALVARLGADLAWAGGRAGLDVGDPAAVERRLAEVRPDVVFNAAAWNAVDLAETRFAEALLVNAAGPAHLARAARACGARLVHVSTDYVFDGTATRPYVEDDPPRPLSLYGVSKLAGEQAVAASGGEHLVVRTSAVLGVGASRSKGGSFVERIVARARAGQPLRVVADQVFSPTSASDLAAALVGLAERGARGLVHVTNSGTCSWHGLAVAALELAGTAAPVAGIRSAELGAPARRPAYSVLSNERAVALGLAPLRPWREALAELLRGA